MTSILKRPKRPFFTPLLLAVVSLQLFSGLSLVFLLKAVIRLEHGTTVYLQTPQGQVLSGRAAPLTHRDPETIRTFAKTIIQGLFQFSIDRELLANDQGLESLVIDGDTVSVPLTLLQASYGLADDLQLPMLQALGAGIPPSVLKGQEHYIVVFDFVSEPMELAPGVWEVQVLGYQKVFQEPNRIAKSLPLKKRLVIQAVALPPPPRGDGVSLESAIYQLRTFGLQVQEIHDIEDKS